MEIIKIILPIVAIIVSSIAIVISNRNTKKQIRVGRLEEILEILHFLERLYTSLFELANDVKKYENYINSNFTTREWEICKGEIHQFFKENSKEVILEKISRFYVLSNAYLPNSKFKFCIISIDRLYAVLFSTIHYKDTLRLKDISMDKIPEPEKVSQIFRKIEAGVIKEMELGFEPISHDTLNTYFEKEFKKECGL